MFSHLALCGIISIAFAILQVNGQYQPTWSSLDSRPLPEWYDDVKFGIFIHWGVYSVPSWAPVHEYAEWYWYQLSQGPTNPVYQFHVATYGKNFMYQDFAPMFDAKLWNPQQWVELFVKSGAKYIVPTSKHHEGFCLWPSAVSWNWNSVDVGPERDILKELFAEIRKYPDMHASLYFSLYEWFNPIYRGPTPHDYVDQIMLPQLFDIVNTYQPDLIFSDGDWEQPDTFWNSTYFLAWLYNSSPVRETIVVNDRWGSNTRGRHGGYYTAEYNAQVWLDHKWEENQGIDLFSFGLNRNSQADDYFPLYNLTYLLIRTVANGGNFLLDVGPTSAGEIPVVMQERLLGLGQWLQVNGEAIYKTKIWSIQNEFGGSVYYTQNKTTGAVYAIMTEWPDSNVLTLAYVVPSSNTVVSMLGYDGDDLYFTYLPKQGFQIHLPPFNPTKLPCQNAWALRMTNVNPPAPVVPLQDWWSGTRQDNLVCGNQACVEDLDQIGGYGRVRIEGIAFQNQINGTIPLTLYYSSANQDFANIGNYNFSDPSYVYVGIQGYISPVQTQQTPVRLDLYWSDQRKDYYLVGTDASREDAEQYKYKFIATQGYAIQGPIYAGSMASKRSKPYEKKPFKNDSKFHGISIQDMP